MSNTATATLKDGRTVEYLLEPEMEGGMKRVYFTKDRTSVVCFFKDSQDMGRMARLEAVVGRFNPTSDAVVGDYFKGLYCWPTAIITSPQLGILAPAYPSDFFFASGPFKGKEKEGRWFSSPKLRKMLPADECGTWINYFKLCILLTRSVRKLHMAGLAHSDLSCKNILVDPSRGRAIMIDIDSLVVPGIFAPDVMGTPGYIAPEVLATLHLPIKDLNRKHPSITTDLHALSVLLYEYLLFRHPLRGPKVNCVDSAEEDERLSMGAKAIYIEHPSDTSNRPPETLVPAKALGPLLDPLFQRAFVTGLHAPNSRPTASEWEKGLLKTWDMLHPCSNARCSHHWFVLRDPRDLRCAFCGSRQSSAVPILKFRMERPPGQWRSDGQLVVYNGIPVFKWHVFDNVSPNEYLPAAEKVPVADCQFHQGQWLLINRALPSLTSAAGNRVPVGQAVALAPGAQIRLSQEPHGRMIEVELARP